MAHRNRGRRPGSSATRPGQTPTPAEIRAAREAIVVDGAPLSQTRAAALVYCGLRTWQQWEAGERRMHPAFWDLWTRKASDMLTMADYVAEETRWRWAGTGTGPRMAP